MSGAAAWREQQGMEGDERGADSQVAEEVVEGVGDPTLEPVKVVASPAVTHVKYRVHH